MRHASPTLTHGGICRATRSLPAPGWGGGVGRSCRAATIQRLIILISFSSSFVRIRRALAHSSSQHQLPSKSE
ncbi:hypothetical protein LZ30DRAFT_669615 [Colletotrichum cereale]|nr:hypothetical protein LZ30DRAFT_669615 [Colletotrichum cereale]